MLPVAESSENVDGPGEPVGLTVREVAYFDGQPRHQRVTALVVHHEGEAGLGKFAERPAVVVPAGAGAAEPDGVHQLQVCQVATRCGQQAHSALVLDGDDEDAGLGHCTHVGNIVTLGHTDERNLRRHVVPFCL